MSFFGIPIINKILYSCDLKVHSCDRMHALEKRFICFDSVEGADVEVPQATLA